VHIIGTQKVRFVSLQKNGSRSLRTILKQYPAIEGWNTSDFDEFCEHSYDEAALKDESITFIFPLRNQFEREQSAMLQDIEANYGTVTDLNELEEHIKRYLKQFRLYKHMLNYFHCSLFIRFVEDLFRSDKDKEIKAKVIFIDLKDLSTKYLNCFLTKLDKSWQDIIIPHVNSSKEDFFKQKILKIIKKLSYDKNSGILDWFNFNNWIASDVEYKFFKTLKGSKYYYPMDRIIKECNKSKSCI